MKSTCGKCKAYTPDCICKNEEVDRETLIKTERFESDEYSEVDYSYRKEETTRVPGEILDYAIENNDDEIIAEWIAMWVDDVPEIEIVSY